MHSCQLVLGPTREFKSQIVFAGRHSAQFQVHNVPNYLLVVVRISTVCQTGSNNLHSSRHKRMDGALTATTTRRTTTIAEAQQQCKYLPQLEVEPLRNELRVVAKRKLQLNFYDKMIQSGSYSNQVIISGSLEISRIIISFRTSRITSSLVPNKIELKIN